ncbi:hypothetical protein MJK70_00785 [Klebsiella pneumoniae]|nr:hypothetical protein MJK70_00785 [Klebsiella pneumoniae]
MIPFNAPPVVGTELDYMQSAMNWVAANCAAMAVLRVLASSGWSNVLAAPKCY